MRYKFVSAVTLILILIMVSFIKAEEIDDTIEALEAEITPVSSPSYKLTGLEVGGLLGVPSGFTMRYWFTDRFGMDAITGLSLDVEPLIGIDMLYKPFGMFHAGTWNLYLTIGAGFMVSFTEKENEYITRFPVGITLPLDNYPVQFTLYGAPALVLNDHVNTKLHWGIAVTYSFARGEFLFEKRQQAIYQNWKLKDENENLKSGLKDTKGRLSKTETDLEQTKGKLSSTENELNSIKTELGATKEEISQLHNTLTSTKGELASMRTSFDDVKLRLDGAKEELNRNQQKLNEKDRELKQNQADLDKAKNIAKAALEGQEREEEEKKIAQKQLQLNKEFKRLSEENISLKKGTEEESKTRNLWKEKCTARRGVLNNDGECVCRVGETWNAKRNACVCVKGYTLNKKTNSCEACSTVDLSGSCVSGCSEDEKQVSMKDGPHNFVCVKRCKGKNEVWLKSSNKCVCADGYYYDNFNKCIPRR